ERVARVLAISCATGAGIDELRWALFELCPASSADLVVEDELPDFLDYQPRARGARYRILRTDRGYRVVGVPPPPEELEEALRRIGIKRGARVEVGEEELEWQ